MYVPQGSPLLEFFETYSSHLSLNLQFSAYLPQRLPGEETVNQALWLVSLTPSPLLLTEAKAQALCQFP